MSRKNSPRLLDLSGKTAIITSGGSATGRSVALRLAEAGAAVLVGDSSLEAAAETAHRIKSLGKDAVAVRADVAGGVDSRAVFETAVAAFGALDIMVDNAGDIPFPAYAQTAEHHRDDALDVNFEGAFLYARAAADMMIASNRPGRIVNIASIKALCPGRSRTLIDAARVGLALVTKSLALQLASHRITVNAIAPGTITTHEAPAVIETARVAGLGSGTASLSCIPLGRMNEPDDIAEAVLFLVSPWADCMTGGCLVAECEYSPL